MRVIVCLDDRDGMAFNGRRQSRDRAVIADIVATVDGPIRMTAYSAALFADTADRVMVVDDPLADAGAADTCFVERPPLADTPIDELIVYRWNRIYPADCHLDLNLDDWRWDWQGEFIGHSHECITKEVWKAWS